MVVVPSASLLHRQNKTEFSPGSSSVSTFKTNLQTVLFVQHYFDLQPNSSKGSKNSYLPVFILRSGNSIVVSNNATRLTSKTRNRWTSRGNGHASFKETKFPSMAVDVMQWPNDPFPLEIFHSRSPLSALSMLIMMCPGVWIQIFFNTLCSSMWDGVGPCKCSSVTAEVSKHGA